MALPKTKVITITLDTDTRDALKATDIAREAAERAKGENNGVKILGIGVK